MKNKNPKPYIYLLASMYVAGLIGLNQNASAELFKTLTPFNLLTSLAILLYFHAEWNKASIYLCSSVFLLGYFVEVLGVNTGLIFGEYQYDTTLGFKLWGVPPLIGVNWLLLVYAVGVVSEQFLKNLGMKILLGAAFLTLFDYLVEPVAIRLEMWSWKNGLPPIQNYIAWFVVSVLLLSLFHGSKFLKQNPIAIWILGFQTLFFLIQHI